MILVMKLPSRDFYLMVVKWLRDMMKEVSEKIHKPQWITKEVEINLGCSRVQQCL